LSRSTPRRNTKSGGESGSWNEALPQSAYELLRSFIAESVAANEYDAPILPRGIDVRGLRADSDNEDLRVLEKIGAEAKDRRGHDRRASFARGAGINHDLDRCDGPWSDLPAQ
jgi:hypothetical protein